MVAGLAQAQAQVAVLTSPLSRTEPPCAISSCSRWPTASTSAVGTSTASCPTVGNSAVARCGGCARNRR